MKALLVDSWYDAYLGVVTLVRVKDGVLKPGLKIRMMATGAAHTVERVGVFTPKRDAGAGRSGPARSASSPPASRPSPIAGSATPSPRTAGPAATPLPGFKPVQPVVFCGLFPTDAADYEQLRDSLAKLRLNDASFEYEPETSAALGFGFRCGFLGLLHLEIIQERLEREFDLDLITTAPSVVYRVHLTNGRRARPAQSGRHARSRCGSTISRSRGSRRRSWCPTPISARCWRCARSGAASQKDLTYAGNRAMVVYRLPLNEVVFDFYDRLKSVSRGYASFDYQIDGYAEGDLVLMNILVNGEPVDALAIIVHRSQAERRGRALCERLKELIPRQLFQIAIQAAIGGRIIARETVKALRKDVLAKCYGGDVSRKRKLLEKQKEGKKRMRQFGKVEIPQSAFLAALKMGDS